MASYDEAIPPGQVGYLNATLDTVKLRGKFSRPITVFTNDPTRSSLRLTIDGTSLASVDVLPGGDVLLSNRRDDLRRTQILVRKDPDETGELLLTDLSSSVDWLTATATRLEGRRPAGNGLPTARPGEYLVDIELTGQAPAGRSTPELRFKTALAREPEVRVPLLVDYTTSLEISAARVVVSSRRGEAEPVLLSVAKGVDPTGLTIATQPSSLTATLEPSGSRYFKLHVAWAGDGAAEGVVTLSLGSEVHRLPVVREP